LAVLPAAGAGSLQQEAARSGPRAADEDLVGGRGRSSGEVGAPSKAVFLFPFFLSVIGDTYVEARQEQRRGRSSFKGGFFVSFFSLSVIGDTYVEAGRAER
jgi:hypothetical protein